MNYSSIKEISDILLRLHITLEAKVQLWLTFKGEKPVSTIQFLPNQTDKDERNFSKLLQSTNLVKTQDLKSNEFIYVSKDIALAKRAAEIMCSESKEDLIEKGKLFGYPPQTAEAYAEGQPMVGIVPSTYHKYWAAYVRYKVRTDHIRKDSLLGKKWADIIRKDIPELASSFESFMDNIKIR